MNALKPNFVRAVARIDDPPFVSGQAAGHRVRRWSTHRTPRSPIPSSWWPRIGRPRWHSLFTRTAVSRRLH